MSDQAIKPKNNAAYLPTVFRLTSQVPAGKVITYGDLATAVGIHPRQVGQILHQNTDPESVPCHRVVNSQGRVARGYAFGGVTAQAQRLAAEGIELHGDRVDLARYRHRLLDAHKTD